MKKFVGFYSRCRFNVWLWVFLSLTGFMVLPSSALALQSGDFTYTVSGGTVTITGITSQACELTPTEVIPAAIDGMPVVGIGDYAFNYCSHLTSVTIPNSVTSIRQGAFYNCTGLTSVAIGNGVTYIGIYAFYNCTGLTSVAIGNSVTSIGDFAFLYCYGLTSVTIPASVRSIGGEAFTYCTRLTSIVVDASNTVYSSQDGVLYNKDRTVLILYPGGKAGGFTIPNSVTSIGNFAFYACPGLTSVTIPDSVTSMGMVAFANCYALTSVTIGNGVTSIGDAAFEWCTGLTSVTIPDSVKGIVEYAFYSCTGLTSVTIGNGVKYIDMYAFSGCTGLTNAYFYGNAPSMGANVFDGCASNFTVCYTAGSTGFTTPAWYGYPAAVCGATLIELASFTATPKAGKVIVQWNTESEIDNSGFNLYRAESENEEYIKINDSLIAAKGSPAQGASYDFIDNDVQNRKTYYYKLEDIDLNGNATMHGPVSATPRLLYEFVK